MAITYGTSQAWGAIRARLGPDPPDTPEALRSQLAQLEAGLSDVARRAESDLRSRLTLLQHRTQLAAIDAQLAQTFAHRELAPRIAAIEQQLRQLRTTGGFLVRIFRWLWAIPAAEAALLHARRQLQLAGHAHLARRDACLREIAWIEHNRPAALHQMLAAYHARLQNFRAAAASPELAGAVMELEMVQRLAALPDPFIVFHDLHLRLPKYRRFDAGRVRSAQLDHLVVGPTGIFVIESKRWSRAFATRAAYHDPFDQVRRAGYVCFKILEAAGLHVRVREIIANGGARLERPAQSHVRICRPEAVAGILLAPSFELTPDTIHAVASVLRSYLA